MKHPYFMGMFVFTSSSDLLHRQALSMVVHFLGSKVLVSSPTGVQLLCAVTGAAAANVSSEKRTAHASGVHACHSSRWFERTIITHSGYIIDIMLYPKLRGLDSHAYTHFQP